MSLATPRGSNLPAMALVGIGRVLVPVTSVAGLKRAVSGVEGVMSWRDTIARNAAL